MHAREILDTVDENGLFYLLDLDLSDFDDPHFHQLLHNLKVTAIELDKYLFQLNYPTLMKTMELMSRHVG